MSTGRTVSRNTDLWQTSSKLLQILVQKKDIKNNLFLFFFLHFFPFTLQQSIKKITSSSKLLSLEI